MTIAKADIMLAILWLLTSQRGMTAKAAKEPSECGALADRIRFRAASWLFRAPIFVGAAPSIL
ncbi:hypothetical protein ABEX25_17905 [Paenibacillus thiaminolyticus]|uniref:hypothetical protein n=1 Tax=Paenibacillus thiaminolyticus TaxID=49283 RepID=UPI003D2D3C48